MALQAFHVQGFGASQACLYLHQVPLTLHPENYSSCPLFYAIPLDWLIQALPTTSQVPLPHHPASAVCAYSEPRFSTAYEMKLQFLRVTLKTGSKSPLQLYLPLLPLMHSCQTQSSAVGWTELKYFTWAFVHPSSSTQTPPWFSPKYFSSELPLHFICTIATVHLNLILSLKTLAFNSCKNHLLHFPASPHWPST